MIINTIATTEHLRVFVTTNLKQVIKGDNSCHSYPVLLGYTVFPGIASPGFPGEKVFLSFVIWFYIQFPQKKKKK